MDNQNSSHTIWYIVGIVVIALALWYVYGQQAPAVITETPITNQTPQTSLSSGDTTADISADLSQTVDSSAALSADASASESAISGF